ILVARNEATLLQAVRVTGEIRIELAVREIETPVAVGDAAREVAGALGIEGLRRIGVAGEAVAIRQRHVARIDAPEIHDGERPENLFLPAIALRVEIERDATDERLGLVPTPRRAVDGRKERKEIRIPERRVEDDLVALGMRIERV